jgi:hypothetical protein
LQISEAEEGFDTVFVTDRVQKGPAGVGLGLHVGARFMGMPREEVRDPPTALSHTDALHGHAERGGERPSNCTVAH